MPDDKSRAAHDAHEDNRHEQAALDKIATLKAHEDHAREDARARTVAPLTQEPVPHEFCTPIPARDDATVIRDRMDAPGDPSTDWPGCVE